MKKNIIKMSLLSLTVLAFFFSSLKAGAVNLIFDMAENLAQRFNNIHFVAPGNSFGGAFFVLPTKELDYPEDLVFSDDTIYCKKMVRGIYYNNQRGQRIWPLDLYTLTYLQNISSGYADLSMEGGIYTTCTGYPYSIFGQVKYTWGGHESYVVAGVDIDYLTNSYIPPFRDSFQYFNNIVPLGYIYDTIGGIGFVGGLLTGHDNLVNSFGSGNNSINNSFTYSGNQIVSKYSGYWRFVSGSQSLIVDNPQAQGTLWNIAVEGNVSLSESIKEEDRQSLLGNVEGSTVVFNAPDITSADLINQTKQRVNQLCRGRSLPSNIGDDQDVLCFVYDNYTTGNAVTINLSSTDYQNKTIIVKNTDVILEDSMSEASPSLDLFVDNGNLYLSDDIANYQGFNGAGYPTSTNPVTSGMFLKGNILVNGLMLGHNDLQLVNFDHKLYFHGKITSLNTPVVPSDGKVRQVEMLLGDKYTGYISLQNIFGWYCDPLLGKGIDGVNCSDELDQYASTPFVVIHNQYPSRLIR